MALRGERELEALIEEIEQPFRNPPSDAGEKVMSLRDRMQRFDEFVFTRRDYAQDLSPLISTKISIPPVLLRFYVQQGRAALADDLKLHLEPVGALPRQETAADRMEVFEAHALLQLDPHGYLRDDMHDAQVRSFFFAAWLEMEKYVVPSQAKGEKDGEYADRVERYRKSWWPYRLTRKPSNAVAWQEDDNRNVTIAVARYKLAVSQILERYGDGRKDDPEQMARILGEHFGYLRVGTASNELYARDVMREEVGVCVVDDGAYCAHYVDLGTLTDSREKGYKALGEGEYKNPFGQPSLLLAEGVYNGDQPMAYRREPLLTSLILIEDQKAVIKSAWASQSASPPQLYEHKMPPEIALMTRESQPPAIVAGLLVDPKGRPLTQRAYGELVNIQSEVNAMQDKLYAELSNEGRIANPAGLLMDPEPGRLDNMPATTILADRDERKVLLAGAKRSETTFWGRALDMIKNAMSNEVNKHRTKGEPKSSNDIAYGFTSTGKEGVLGKAVKRGEAFEITPQDLDNEFTRTIETQDNRISTRMAMLDVAERRWAAGTILYDERLGMHGVENVAEFKEKKAEEQLYQLEAIRLVQATRLRVAQFMQVLTGRPVEETVASMPDNVLPSVAGPEASAPGGGGMFMKPPPTDQMPEGGPQVMT